METIAEDLQTMVRRPLQPGHIELLRAEGRVRRLEAGETLLAPGAPLETFVLVEEGEIEALDPVQGRRIGDATLGPTQFVGEINFLSGARNMSHVRAVRPSLVLEVPRARVLELMARIPEMSDIIVSVFAARRRRMIEGGFGGISIIGEEDDRAAQALARFASRNRLPYRLIKPGSAAAAELSARCDLAQGGVRVVIAEREVLETPTIEALARAIGLELPAPSEAPVDLVVVGAGPAGIAAAVYGASEGLRTLVVEDTALGGQAGTSSRIENYMGFPTGISGADLAWRGEVQAMKFGARFMLPRRADGLAVQPDGGFAVQLDDGSEIGAGAVVIATGVQYRRLPIPGLEAFEGAGVYYAATELEARFCRGAEVVVIGGGNSAGQAAMFLSRSASCVTLLVRGAGLASSMSSYLVERLESDPAIRIRTGAEMTAVHGEGALEEISVRDTAAGAEARMPARAVFVMVGAAPNTDWLSGHVALDARGFVRTGRGVGGRSSYETSCPGIFAVGDVRAGSVKRVASATGEGSVVVSKVWEHFDERRHAGAAAKAD